MQRVKSNYGVGLGLTIVGVLLVGTNLITINYYSFYLPKLYMLGAIAGCIGIGFLIFPGYHADVNDRQNFWKDKWTKSSILARIVWILCAGTGLFLGIQILLKYGI